MSEPTEAQLAEWKVAGVLKFEKNGHVFYLRSPNDFEYRRFDMDTAGEPKAVYDASLVLAKSCVVFPTGDELDAKLKAKPGLVKELGLELQCLAHDNAKAEAKKL